MAMTAKLGYKARLLLTLARNGKLPLPTLWNFARNRLHFKLNRQIQNYHPSILFVDPSSQCNLECVECLDKRTAFFGDDRTQMSLEQFRKIVAEIRRKTLMVALYWWSEPLVNRDIYAMVELLAENRIGSMLSTNGMLLTQENARRLLDARLDYMKLTISGMTQETYVQYHRKGNIAKILENFEYLMHYMQEQNRHTLVMVDFLAFSYNRGEVEQAREYFGRFGVHVNVREAYLTNETRAQPEHLAAPPPPNRQPCDWLWGITAINHRGQVYPCCHEDAIKCNGVMGALDTDSLTTVCNNPTYRALRQAHMEGKREKISYCRFCYYKNIDFQ